MEKNKTIETEVATTEPTQDIDVNNQDTVKEQPATEDNKTIDDKIDVKDEESVDKKSNKSSKTQQTQIDFDNLDEKTKNDFLDKIDPELLLEKVKANRKKLNPEMSEQLTNTILEQNQKEYFNGKTEEYNEFIKNAPNFYLEEKAFYDKQFELNGIDEKERFDKDGNLTKTALASIINMLALQQRQAKKFTKQDNIMTNNVSNQQNNTKDVPYGFHLWSPQERDEYSKKHKIGKYLNN